MSDRYDTVCVPDCTLTRSTDKAGLYAIEGVNDLIWIPFSQLRECPETGEESVDRDGDDGNLFIPRWLADEKGIDFQEYEQ